MLEGGQATSCLLLAGLAALYLGVVPYTLEPGPGVCLVRGVTPGLAFCLPLAATLSRALLLATADSDGLPGHASGALQAVLALLLLGVQVRQNWSPSLKKSFV